MESEEFNIEALPVKISYIGETTREENWKCDAWNVEITYKNDKCAGFWTTQYYTGLGLRKQPAKNAPSFIVAKTVKPTVANVLHSLFMDAQAADMNFNDWCAEYGFSDDSLKALNTYKQCLEIATTLRKAFDAETRKNIETAVQDL